MSALDAKGIHCSAVQEPPWGLLTTIKLPGGGELGLYQPKHPTAAKLEFPDDRRILMTDSKTATAKGPELTARSIIVGLLVAVVIGAAYPYCVLKLGFGPNLSVVSAFFGFIALVLILRAADTNPRENNIVQTMGTSAGQTAFMAVLLAAFDMLNAKGVLNPPIYLNTLQIFCWLCSASLLGILLAVPMRRHYIDEENLTYADGLAAGETIKVLHEGTRKRTLKGAAGRARNRHILIRRSDDGHDFLQMGQGHLVYSRQGSNEHRLQHQPVEFRFGLAGRFSNLSGDGDWHRHQLVHSASLPLFAWNDYGADLSGHAALGDVAGDGIDGGGRTDVIGLEMESDRQDFSRPKGEQDRRLNEFPDAVGGDRFDRDDRNHLSGPIFQHGNSGLSLVDRDSSFRCR